MAYQPDPKYFQFGQAFQQGIQQSQDNKRRNALMDLEQRQFGLNEQRVGLEQKRYDQAEQERQAAMQAQAKKEGIGLKALAASRGDKQSGMAVLQELGLPVEFADDPDAEEMYQAIAEQYGGFSMPAAQDSSFTLGPGQQRYGPDGRVIASVPATPDRPQDPGYNEGAGINPATGQPEKYLRDRNGNIRWTGIAPVPPAASLKDQLDADKVTEAKSRVSGNLDALNEYYGELSNLGAAVDTSKEGVGNVSAAVRSSGFGQLGGKLFGTQEQSVRNKINQMRPLLLQEIRQASAMGARGLDSNKELEFYLQAATDPSRDVQANIAALNVLSNAYGLGKAYGEASPEGVNQLNSDYLKTLPLVTNDAQYKALAKGSEYRDVSGKRWKKK